MVNYITREDFRSKERLLVFLQICTLTNEWYILINYSLLFKSNGKKFVNVVETFNEKETICFENQAFDLEHLINQFEYL